MIILIMYFFLLSNLSRAVRWNMLHQSHWASSPACEQFLRHRDQPRQPGSFSPGGLNWSGKFWPKYENARKPIR